ncbi:DUF3710 domain-containing protein [Sanguibacter sp. A247]|uniref:DUF3710 domain-containing protein n=1 Tax=unclassified Sanguibacter TaxID=2645534 RepID=UPI003FD81BC8
MVATPEAVVPEEATHGPWDRSDVENDDGRIDLGAVWLPGVPGMQMRMEIDKATNQVAGVAVMVDGVSLQVQVFAAPRTTGIWDEIREEISTSLTEQGASVDDIVGPFGRELLARATFREENGAKTLRVIRFLGVDGPRWFLRGVINGPAEIATDGAAHVEAIFREIVVVRDDVARAPRELLELHEPRLGSGGTGVAKVDETPRAPITPPERGPEITQIG